MFASLRTVSPVPQISLEIPEHLILAILQKLDYNEFKRFARSCRFINRLVQANLKVFNICVGHYLNVGMINRDDLPNLYENYNYIPASHDTKIHFYDRFLSEVYTTFHETFEFSQLGEHLQRFSWCKPSIIKFGCSLRFPESTHFSLEKFQKLLEELGKIKMTCDKLEMFTFTGVENALRTLKPKQLEIFLEDNNVLGRVSPEVLLKLDEFSLFGEFDLKVVMREIVPYCKNMKLRTNLTDVKEELPIFVQKLIVGTICTQSLSMTLFVAMFQEIKELTTSLINLSKEVTINYTLPNIIHISIRLEEKYIIIIIEETTYGTEIKVSITKEVIINQREDSQNLMNDSHNETPTFCCCRIQ